MSFAVITENDTSPWMDQTGVLYHFPKRYLSILQPGTDIVYYKGRMTNKAFSKQRLSADPHYFGVGKIGSVEIDSSSRKQDHFATITSYKQFDRAVPFKLKGSYFEEIPETREKNYFRDGVRSISSKTYVLILEAASSVPNNDPFMYTDIEPGASTFETEIWDGDKRKVYSTRYERDRKLRDQAIAIHGLTCKGCGINFRTTYGIWGDGFIHVHHLNPVSGGKRKVQPETDLIVVCANCHSMIHRRRNQLLTIEEVQQLIAQNRN